MYCTNCGNQIEEECAYCNYCGDKILDKDINEDTKEPEKIDKIEDTKEPEKIDKIEDTKEPEKIEEIDISKTSVSLIILLLASISIALIVNMTKSYMTERDINDYIFGQAIFGLIFIPSTILMLKSKKIGAYILIPFILFKMMSSIYYYLNYGYIIKNLIADEIFYMSVIILLIIGWKNLK